VFERFTERARQVVVFAQQEARDLGHNYIGTEHLLLGLLREEDGLGARTLASAGVTLEDARARVEIIIGRGEGQPTGQIPFTPRAKKALELALREAMGLGHNYIGSEHVLLGLTRANENMASRVLHELGVDAESLRSRLLALLGVKNPARTPLPPMPRVAGVRTQMPLPGHPLILGWLLFAIALGVGIAIGWAIWG